MYEGPIQDLIDELSRLPGIGPKSAQRLAFHLVKTAPEEAKDAATIEKAGVIRGRYHVLGGAISPLDGVGPDDLSVRELMDRVQRNGVSEVILATNPNLEGNATAMYIAALLKPSGVRVTRLASGLPVGGDLEYVGEITLSQA